MDWLDRDIKDECGEKKLTINKSWKLVRPAFSHAKQGSDNQSQAKTGSIAARTHFPKPGISYVLGTDAQQNTRSYDGFTQNTQSIEEGKWMKNNIK